MRQFLVIILIILSVLSCKKGSESNYYLEYYNNGNIKKLVTINSEEKGDSTIVYYYENGNISQAISYKKGVIYPSEVTFYKTGGVYILRQYIHAYSSPSSNQIYTFDRNQNIMPELSLFSIINREDELNYKLQYITGFGTKLFNVCLIDSIETIKFHCAQEIAYTDIEHLKAPLFEYNPKTYNTIGIFLGQEGKDSITSFIFNR